VKIVLNDTIRIRILLTLLIIVSIAFFSVGYASTKTINSYQDAYIECLDAYTMAENNILPLWDGSQIVLSEFNGTVGGFNVT
jgi:hypothetical protein